MISSPGVLLLFLPMLLANFLQEQLKRDTMADLMQYKKEVLGEDKLLEDIRENLLQDKNQDLFVGVVAQFLKDTESEAKPTKDPIGAFTTYCKRFFSAYRGENLFKETCKKSLQNEDKMPSESVCEKLFQDKGVPVAEDVCTQFLIYDQDPSDEDTLGQGQVEDKLEKEDTLGRGKLDDELEEQDPWGLGKFEDKLKKEDTLGRGKLDDELEEQDPWGLGKFEDKLKKEDTWGPETFDGKLKKEDTLGRGKLDDKLKKEDTWGLGKFEDKLKDDNEFEDEDTGGKFGDKLAAVCEKNLVLCESVAIDRTIPTAWQDICSKLLAVCEKALQGKCFEDGENECQKILDNVGPKIAEEFPEAGVAVKLHEVQDKEPLDSRIHNFLHQTPEKKQVAKLFPIGNDGQSQSSSRSRRLKIMLTSQSSS